MARDGENSPSQEEELDLDLLWDEDPELEAASPEPDTHNPCKKATVCMALDDLESAASSGDSAELRAAMARSRDSGSSSTSSPAHDAVVATPVVPSPSASAIPAAETRPNPAVGSPGKEAGANPAPEPASSPESSPSFPYIAEEPDALGLVARHAEGSEQPSTATFPVVVPGETPAPSPEGPRRAEQDMRDRFDVGDYTGALELAQTILSNQPDDIQAQQVEEACTATLTQMYEARLGSLAQRPSLGLPIDQVRWLALDHRAGFLLSLLDGQLSVDDILDVSGMPRLDAMRLLAALVEQRVIALAPPG